MNIVQATAKAGLTVARSPFMKMIIAATAGFIAQNAAGKVYTKLVDETPKTETTVS